MKSGAFLLSLTISVLMFWIVAWIVVVEPSVECLKRWTMRRCLRGSSWKKMKKSLDNLNRVLDDIERDIEKAQTTQTPDDTR
jgi:hypothetical protein